MLDQASSPLVSIVVATLNSADTLPNCLASLFAQTYPGREIIIIDGNSDDRTREILLGAGKMLAHWVSEPDEGIYHAWNKAVRVAKGEWICFLGADDELSDPGALEALVGGAKGAAGRRVVYGRINLVTRSGKIAETAGKPWPAAKADLLAGFMIPQPATLHHRSLFREHGYFDQSYRIAGDYEFLLRELVEHEALFVDRVVANMRLGGMSVRANSIHRALLEVANARRKHGLGRSTRLYVALAASWMGAHIHRLLGERIFNSLADGYRVVRGKPRLWSV